MGKETTQGLLDRRGVVPHPSPAPLSFSVKTPIFSCRFFYFPENAAILLTAVTLL